MSNEKKPAVPAPNYAAAAALLIAAIDGDIKAAEIIGNGAKSKDVAEGLERHGVPAHKVKSFIGVYRAYNHGKSLGFPIEELRKADPRSLRLIGSAMTGDNAKNVTKDVFDLAINSDAASVLKAVDPEAAQKAEKREEQKKERDALTPLERFGTDLQALVTKSTSEGATMADLIDTLEAVTAALHKTQRKGKKPAKAEAAETAAAA